jgi:DNA invertase Pin-like site-specific DNA recombinase
MHIGFLRSSASLEALKDILEELEKAGCERIVVDSAASPDPQQGMLAAVLARLSEGDCLTVWSLDSVAASMPELVDLVIGLQDRNIRFRSIAEGFDSNGRTRAVLRSVLAQLQSFEHRRQSRQREEQLGRKVGRPRLLDSEHIEQARALLREGRSMDDVAKELNVSRATLYRYIEGGNR